MNQKHDVLKLQMSHSALLTVKLVLNTMPGWLVMLLEEKLDLTGIILICIGAGFWYWRQAVENLKIMRESKGIKLDNDKKQAEIRKMATSITTQAEFKSLIRKEFDHLRREEETLKNLNDEQ